MFGLAQRRTTAERSTIIALRATHTAHRVATDVAYPELPAEQVRSAQPVELHDADRQVFPPLILEIRDEFSAWQIALVIGLLLVALTLPFLLSRL